MAIRYHDATRLYNETRKRISRNDREWTNFLKSACKNYRLPFADMIMIYAQRPDASAVLEMEEWNKRYGLWIKPGSRGIAVFDGEFVGSSRLKYYFDISDTKLTEHYRPVPIWSMQKGYEEDVIKTLSEQFGSSSNESNIALAIVSAVENIVEDNIDDYVKELKYVTSDSLLEELDEINMSIIYKNALTSSIVYMALTRCDIYAEDYISKESLSLISQFNTVESLNALGVPTKDMSQMIIGEIRKCVLTLIREDRTFVKTTHHDYNETVNTPTQQGRSQNDETRILASGRISDSQFNTETGGSTAVREIRNDEEKISQGASSDSVHKLSDDTDIESTSTGNRPDSHAEERIDDKAADGTNGRERATESDQSDGVGYEDESDRGNNPREHHERIDLQLDEVPAVGTSYEMPTFFTLDEFEELIKHDKFRTHKNKDIQTFYQFYSEPEKRLNYVKESFSKTIIETIYQNQRMGFYPDEDKNALRVWKGGYLNPDHEAYVSWEDITVFIEDMIERNIYLSIPLKPIPTTEEQQLNLFDMEPLEPTQNNREAIPFAMPQYIVDAVLAEGTAYKESKTRIAIFLSLDRPIEENAAFLKDIYDDGSNGFIINQRNVSFKWDSTGMQIAWGKGVASALNKQFMSWEEVAKGIRNLLDHGRYLSQEELDACKSFEYHDMAEKLLYMCQDMDFDESDHMMELREYYRLGFVKAPPKVAKLLEDKEFYDRTMDDLREFNKDYQVNPELMRNNWRQYAPNNIIPLMERLAMPHIQFKSSDYKDMEHNYFVTQDTIDSMVSLEHRVNQKYDTYAFFKNHSDKKERIKFLKDIWGQGGSSRYDSSSKGLQIKTGTYNNPYAEILLKWKDVAERVSYLIANEKFLNADEIKGMDDYERKSITSEIRRFFYSLPFNNIRPYSVSIDIFQEDHSLNEFIKDMDNVEHVLDLMQIALNNTDESAKSYEDMKKYFAHTNQFYQGTYSLFNQKKEPRISNPYSPILDINQTIGFLFTRFMEHYDGYEFDEDYTHTDSENFIESNIALLNDIAGLEDTILLLNEAEIICNKDKSMLVMIRVLRDELSMVYAQRKGSDLTQVNETKLSFHSYISQEEPRYNTGDFVFMKYERQYVYARIELIEESSIIVQHFSDDFKFNTLVNSELEIDKDTFENAIIIDPRNAYLYDQNRPLYRNNEEEGGLQFLSDEKRNTLGYENYVLLNRIAPLLFQNKTETMNFAKVNNDDTITISLSSNKLTIKELANNNIYEFIFSYDDFFKTANIRIINNNGESEVLEVIDDEPNDYEIELQMNEEANTYIKSIAERGYYLQSFDMRLNGKNTNITYGEDGNISSFDGDIVEFDYFMDHYYDEPIQKISSLIPINSDNKENIQRNEAIDAAHENYKLLNKIAPLIVSGESEYMHFVAGEHMMPLSIEVVGDRIAMSHYYKQNGDMMADPDMEFVLNTDKKTLCARTFQQDNMNYYRDVEMNGDVVVDTELEQELNEFTKQWLNNIIDQEYYLETVRVYPDNYPIDVIYGEDGNISAFDGTDDELAWFRERYGDSPHEKISILIPEIEVDELEEEKTPTQRNDEDISSSDSVQEEKSSISNAQQLPNIASQKLLPEIPQTERNNFKITDYELGVGGQKEKYKANSTAIRLLKQLEQEQRLATLKEQTILSKYVGWGAMPDAFDDTKENWKQEYNELKELLTKEEYEAARESTLTAFYTPPIVIEAIYNKLQAMGLQEGNILEPSCGIGNFIGMQPSGMDCNFYGIELDEISGKIAQQLYQKSTIAIQAFEKTEIPDNLFDAVIGNVPYGQVPVFDTRYNQQNFMIHDYFFAKALDKVKVGGVVIFLTSMYTMDKKNRNVRKYLAQRADLLGAIRLPDNTFTKNAGTRVTTDILVLQKHERPSIDEPEWIDIGADENGIVMNRYFIDHPEMVLGSMITETSQYGFSTVCKAKEGADLKEQLSNAMSHIQSSIMYESTLYIDEEDASIPADPTVRNFSYCVVDGSIYYRENSRMYPYKTSKTGDNRIRGMIQIRDCMRRLIVLQTNDSDINEIKREQQALHELYDTFTKKYDLLNNRANKLAFQDDSSYNLICSLEVLDEDRTLKRKADIFDKRTIKPRTPVTSVKTASEALMVSMSEKGCIDFDFMTKISSIEKSELIQSLQGVIFPNPERLSEDGTPVYESADEYLSGNVREKLMLAKHASNKDALYNINVEALKKVQPERIKAGDISVRLGTAWIPIEIYQQFMYELLDTPKWYQKDIKVLYLSSTQEWNVTRKSLDRGVKASISYGTHRINGYKIIENTLNLRDVKIFDTQYEDGKEVRVLNKKETAIAQDKQEIIKAKFIEWIWKDVERRNRLCDIYNEKYNSIRNRTYNGNSLSFIGMNPNIQLRKHQVDAIARILYGGNTLLAHSVGAGKTFEMIAAGMESKRLGFSNKPLYVVPNNIIGDFAADFHRLYPSANILVATTDTLAKANRHKFFSKISTGDWDGIIITHSQFIKMPVSQERQSALINRQIDEIVNNIAMCKEQDGERFTIKQLEKMKKKLEVKLEKLNDSSKKDDILCFEQLGIDMLFVDEADLFKNLFIYSKMRNVAGISQTDSQRASDLFMKTQYLDEITNYRGVVFATGTAISNSMSELYTMQRYLQFDTLRKYGLESFDAWASTFGETVTAMELAPEGTGFKMKTRFSKFFNLPELMTMFREVADIQTADMLDLPVPKAEFKVSSVPASEEQAKMIESLAERAEKVRNREVQPYEDNMLKITNDGRKLALDQRLMNPLLPENKGSKVNACVNNAYEFWNESSNISGTQLIFCDLSTPSKDSKFITNSIEDTDVEVIESEFANVYVELKKKLIDRGIPPEEIAFIHDTKTDVQRKELFAQVRQGNVRILIGSTSKMGAGTNVQDLIVALHDLDCPWRPRDLEQRRGRGIRQGNINESVTVYRYVTESTFDAYLYQTIEKKQQFISQILTGKTPQRVMEEIDEAVLNYAEIKAIACGDPKIMERCNLELEVNKLGVLQASYRNQKYDLQDSILKKFPKAISEYEEKIKCLKKDIKTRNSQPLPEGDQFIGMVLDTILYSDKTEAGNMLIELCKKNTTSQFVEIGEYRSFKMLCSFNSLTAEYMLTLENKWHYAITLGTDKLGNITRINNALNGMEKQLEEAEQNLSSTLSQLEVAKIEVDRPFEYEAELQEKTKRLAQLTIELKLDQKDPAVIDENEIDTDVENDKNLKERHHER